VDVAGCVSRGDGVGGAAGVLGVPLPAVETCLALSGLMLGLLMAFATKPPGCVKSVHPAVLLGVALCAGTFLAIDKNPDTLSFCALFAAGAMQWDWIQPSMPGLPPPWPKRFWETGLA
jgi:HupE / UreJ protein